MTARVSLGFRIESELLETLRRQLTIEKTLAGPNTWKPPTMTDLLHLLLARGLEAWRMERRPQASKVSGVAKA